MDGKLMEEAKKYGINASMYNMLRPQLRENAMQKDIAHAKARAKKKGAANGQN